MASPSSETQQLKLKQEIPVENSQDSVIAPKPGNQRVLETWTEDQITLFYDLYKKYGSKWPLISRSLNRSLISVKNKFYGNLRKLYRRLSYVGSRILTPKNPIHDKAFMVVFTARNLYSQPFEGYNQQQQELQGLILHHAQFDGENISVEDCEQLIQAIHRFNTRTRPFNLKKFKKIKAEASWDDLSRKILKSQEVKAEEQNGGETKSEDGEIKMMDHQEIEKAYNAAKRNDAFQFQVPVSNLFQYIS